MTQLVFARQSGATAAFSEFSGERLLNMHARPFPDQGVGPFILAPSPGLTALVTLQAGAPVRAIYSQRDVTYAACGAQFWRIVDGVAQALGSITDSALTTITGNGSDVAVAAGGLYYVWDGSTFTQRTTGALSAVQNIASIDGYVLLFEQGGQKWAVSGLQDASTVDALDFASAEGAPDNIIAGHVDHSEVWIFGTRSTEIWANTGDADFPFARISGGKLDRGCAFQGSVASEDNSVLWVGDDRVVYRANGYAPSRISTQAVEAVLSGLAADADVRAFTFTQEGSKVYAMILPDRPAWLYDFASGVWHERNTGVDEGRWIATCACRCGAMQMVGTTDGRVATLGGLTDAGGVILREGVSLPITASRDRISISEVQMNFRTGATDLGRVAQVMLQASRDGRTWGVERWRPLGSLGQYDRTVRWFGFGVGRQFQFRFRISDPIEVALFGATVK